MSIDVRPSEWAKPLPDTDDLSEVFWKAAAVGRLLIQRCPSCGKRQHYPRQICIECGGDPEWEEASGNGTVYTFTVIRQNGARGFREETPYVVAMIDLEEGPRMMGRITGVPVEDVHIGMPVRAYSVQVEESLGIVQWEPTR